LEIDERTLCEMASEKQDGQNDSKIHGPAVRTQANPIAV
jgi:hypothetical protein